VKRKAVDKLLMVAGPRFLSLSSTLANRIADLSVEDTRREMLERSGVDLHQVLCSFENETAWDVLTKLCRQCGVTSVWSALAEIEGETGYENRGIGG
jgi:hypothetical protein